ncbi:hypothetical protein Gpo141_00003576 [Globisporangium polare]
MGLRSTRRWRSSLLLLWAIACVCAALVAVSALHDSLFASAAGSEYAGALRDDVIAMEDDDDDDDSDDMPAFALEAAQEDAARLLDSFDEGDFLVDDEDDSGDGGDVESADEEPEEEEQSDAEEHEDASDSPVRIEYRRSDATVEDEDEEVDASVEYKESDEQRELESEDGGGEEAEIGEHDDEEPGASEDEEQDSRDQHQPVEEGERKDEHMEREYWRSDATVKDADTDRDMHVEYEAIDEQAELELEDAAVEKVEIAEQLGAVANEKPKDGEQRVVDREESEDGDTEHESNGISKRVGAVFLKVRGVIFPNGDTKKLDNPAATLGEDVEPDFDQTSFDAELLSVAVDGPVNDNELFSSYRKSTAVVEQSPSFPEASQESTENEQDAEPLSDVHADPVNDVLFSSYGESVTVFEPSFSLSSASSEEEEDFTSLSIDVEPSDREALEVEIHPHPVELTVSSSEEDETMVRVTVNAANEAEELVTAVEEAIAAAVTSAQCTADRDSDAALCQSQFPEHIPVESTNNDSPTAVNTAYESLGSAVSGFQEIVLEMATAAEQMVMAFRHGHRPHLPATVSEARAKVGAGVKAVVDPTRDTIHLLRQYSAVAKTETGAALEVVSTHLSYLYEYLKLTLSTRSQHASSAYLQVSQWCVEMWNTYNEVRILGRNLLGLALLAPCGLLFFSLYHVVAAVPEFLCTYFLTFDEVTRAQLKIFSVVLLVVLFYHARVLAWFWLLLSAALGYYYWSGHVVISVKFK